MEHDILVLVFLLHDGFFLTILLHGIIVLLLFILCFLRFVFLEIILFSFAFILSTTGLIDDHVEDIFRFL